jgi:hypothetical protein
MPGVKLACMRKGRLARVLRRGECRLEEGNYRAAGVLQQSVRSAPGVAGVRVARELDAIRDEVEHVVVVVLGVHAHPARQRQIRPRAWDARLCTSTLLHGGRTGGRFALPDTSAWQVAAHRALTCPSCQYRRPTGGSHRSVAAPSSMSPRRMSSNSAKDSSTGRSRQGLGRRSSLHQALPPAQLCQAGVCGCAVLWCPQYLGACWACRPAADGHGKHSLEAEGPQGKGAARL